jgi:hypothetical protein
LNFKKEFEAIGGKSRNEIGGFLKPYWQKIFFSLHIYEKVVCCSDTYLPLGFFPEVFYEGSAIVTFATCFVNSLQPLASLTQHG